MIATTNAIAKIAAVAAGLGLVAVSFASFAPAAKAATVDEQIAALLAQIEALKGGSSMSTTFTMDLTIGSTGAEVTALQNWLISKSYSIPAGATGYFGTQTQAALAAFQAANGITPAVGYFGPITRAKVNSMGGSTGSTGGSTGGSLSGGEASLGTVDGSSGDDDEVEEGASADIAEFEFDVDDADIRISRIDLEFTTTNNGTTEEDEPWDTFDTITLLDENGDEIASADVSDEDDWLEEDTPFKFRFTNVDWVIEEDETATFIVQVEAQNSVDGADETNSWTVNVPNDGIRGIDGAGLDQYTGEGNDGQSFDVVEEGQGEALNVNTSTEDPDPSTIEVKDDAVSGWTTVFVFDLEAEENDIVLDTIPVDFTSSAADINAVISDAKLVIDGEEFDDFDFVNGGEAFGSTSFDIDDKFTIDADDEVEVEVMVKFKAANGSNYNEGNTITASVVGANITGEGADDVVGDGDVDGETHTLVVDGLNASLVETDTTTTVKDSVADTTTFSITVALKAFGDDVYLATTTTEDTTLGSVGASTGWNFDLTGTSTTNYLERNVTSTADTTTVSGLDYFIVRDGETEEFTLNVIGSSNTSIFAQLKLGAIQYGTTTSAAFAQTLYLESNDYKTSSVNLNF